MSPVVWAHSTKIAPKDTKSVFFFLAGDKIRIFFIWRINNLCVLVLKKYLHGKKIHNIAITRPLKFYITEFYRKLHQSVLS